MSASTDPRPPFSRSASFGYDLARWPHADYHRLTFDNIAVATFTLGSGTEEVRSVDPFGTGTTRYTVEDFPTFQSKDTDLTLLHDGDSTDFTRLYQMYTPIDALVDKIVFNVGVAMNVSAYTSGNFRLDRVNVVLRSLTAAGKEAFRMEPKFVNFTTTNMTGIDNQIVVLNRSINGPFPIYAGGILEISFDINAVTGTGTYQKGILDSFPYVPTGGLRTYSSSGFKIYYRPLPIPDGNVLTPTTFAKYDGGSPQ